MIRIRARSAFLGASLVVVALAGCQTEGIFKAKKCPECANSTCTRHNVNPKDLPETIVTPSQSPFIPYTTQK